jgi:DNA (cytosine-5)-methyltransferase 1
MIAFRIREKARAARAGSGEQQRELASARETSMLSKLLAQNPLHQVELCPCPSIFYTEGADVPRREFTVLSLFSGGMGLDIGLEKTGQFTLLACVEKVPAFCETIRINRDAGRIGSRHLHVYQADISELGPYKIMADLGQEPQSLDLVVGGPPCQAFSVFGKRRGLADGRGKLILEYVRFVEAFRPRVFVMENVRGLLSMTTEDNKRKGALFRMVQDRFDGLGYRTDCFVVNSVNYGAPQIRERILLIGNRYNLLADFPRPTHSDRPEDKLPPFATLGDAIRHKPDPDETVMHFSERKKNYLAMVPLGGNWRSLPLAVQKESMGKSFYLKGGRSAHWRKLSFEFPCPTVMTLPNHAGTSMCHPDLLRPLTVGECMLVQGFPPEWSFVGTPGEKYRQVGNAVPIVLGCLAGRSVIDLLEKIAAIRSLAPGPTRANRVVHLRPHVRTRWWWKDGQIIDKLPYAQRPSRKQVRNDEPSLFDWTSASTEEEL